MKCSHQRLEKNPISDRTLYPKPWEKASLASYKPSIVSFQVRIIFIECTEKRLVIAFFLQMLLGCRVSPIEGFIWSFRASSFQNHSAFWIASTAPQKKHQNALGQQAKLSQPCHPYSCYVAELPCCFSCKQAILSRAYFAHRYGILLAISSAIRGPCLSLLLNRFYTYPKEFWRRELWTERLQNLQGSVESGFEWDCEPKYFLICRYGIHPSITTPSCVTSM